MAAVDLVAVAEHRLLDPRADGPKLVALELTGLEHPLDYLGSQALAVLLARVPRPRMTTELRHDLVEVVAVQVLDDLMRAARSVPRRAFEAPALRARRCLYGHRLR